MPSTVFPHGSDPQPHQQRVRFGPLLVPALGEAILSSLREFRIAVTILSLSSVLLEGILSSPKFRGNPT